jgi:hypothetical protein
MTDQRQLTIRITQNESIKDSQVFLQERIVLIGTENEAIVDACGDYGTMQLLRYQLDGKSGGKFTIAIHSAGQLVFEETATIPDENTYYDSYFRFFRN